MNYIFLPAIEFALTLFYSLNLDRQKGWFNNPTVGEGLVLLILASLAAFCFWLSFNDQRSLLKQIPLPHRYGVIWTLVVISSVLALVLFFIPAPQTTNSVLSLLKNKLFWGVLAITGLETILYLWSRSSRKLGNSFQIAGNFLIKYGVILIFLALLVVKLILLVPITRGLVVLNDTYLYWKMANQIFHGYLDIINYHHYPPLYPIILSPVFMFGVKNSLQHITILNSEISSTAIFPLYLLARQFLDKRISLLFVLICAVFPFHIVYPEIIFSENLFYPLFFWAMYFAYINPPNNRTKWLVDILFAFSLVALVLTRYMSIPLIPIYMFIWWIKPENGMNRLHFAITRAKLIKLGVIIAVFFGIYGIWFFSGLSAGVDVKSMLGFTAEEIIDPNTHAPGHYLFWIGIGAAYLVLILAPVMNSLLFAVFSWRKIKWEAKLIQWILMAVALIGMLMVVVIRHAIQADYNLGGPSKFIGRYIIYISAVGWLTGLILIKNVLNNSKRIIGMSAILAAGFILSSYCVFFSPSGFMDQLLVRFRDIDVYYISLIRWIFLVGIGGLIIGSSILIFKKKHNSLIAFICGLVFCIYLSAWPTYFEVIKNAEKRTFHLDMLLSKVLEKNNRGNGALELLVMPGSDFYDKELEVRGYDVADIKIGEMRKSQYYINNCRTRLIAKNTDGQLFGVVDKSATCTVGDDQILSTYMYNGEEFAIITVPTNLN